MLIMKFINKNRCSYICKIYASEAIYNIYIIHFILDHAKADFENIVILSSNGLKCTNFILLYQSLRKSVKKWLIGLWHGGII